MSTDRHRGLVKGASKLKSELELGLLQMQVLWLLKRPTHGYALMKSLNELKQTKITQGTLYPALQRLEELGMIRSRSAGRKRIWSLTERGKHTMHRACLDFCRTFQGIFHDFVCGKCR